MQAAQLLLQAGGGDGLLGADNAGLAVINSSETQDVQVGFWPNHRPVDAAYVAMIDAGTSFSSIHHRLMPDECAHDGCSQQCSIHIKRRYLWVS